MSHYLSPLLILCNNIVGYNLYIINIYFIICYFFC
ncbi:hypothetical protein TPDSLph2_CDS0033 [Terrisporobacter phage TPDSL_ph2]